MKNIILLFVAFLATEFLLQAVCIFSPHVDSMIFKSYATGPVTLGGGASGRMGNPDRADHDANGYRNKKVPDTASIVVLGDSQSYGTNVFREEAWPYLVQHRTGLTTYNMGLGGYGPAHNLLQLDQALALSPELVIVAIYFGNDFFDNFRLSLRNERISRFLNKDELQLIKDLENNSPIREKAHVLFRRGARAPEPGNISQVHEKSAIHDWLSRHSALWGLLRESKNAVKTYLAGEGILANRFEIATAAITREQLNYSSIFEGEDWRTILTSPYRDLVNDRSDPRVDLGFDITLRLLPEMQGRVRSSGADLLIMLIPTKESVFAKRVIVPDKHIGYSSLVSNEGNNREQLIEFLEREKIQYIDVLSVLQMAEHQPYPENADGHPNPFGHSIIADRVIDWLQQKQRAASIGLASVTGTD